MLKFMTWLFDFIIRVGIWLIRPEILITAGVISIIFSISVIIGGKVIKNSQILNESWRNFFAAAMGVLGTISIFINITIFTIGGFLLW